MIVAATCICTPPDLAARRLVTMAIISIGQHSNRGTLTRRWLMNAGDCGGWELAGGPVKIVVRGIDPRAHQFFQMHFCSVGAWSRPGARTPRTCGSALRQDNR